MRRAALLALLFSATAQAQGWRWISPKPQGVAVNAVTFYGSQGWLVGAGGTIATTTDGAATFSARTSGVTADLYAISFESPKYGWAVGDLGTILVTHDAGKTWMPQASGTTRRLHGVWFTDALHGIAVGDFRTLLQTADGGQTWTGRGTSALSLDAVTFTDSLHGFMCGDGGVIVLTTDGGNTFVTVQTPSTAHLLAISFSDSLHGFAVGEGGALVATSDGGQSWTAQTLGTGVDDLIAVVASSSTQAYVLAASGHLYTTADGSTWTVPEQLSAEGLFTALALEPTTSAWDATAQSGQWLRAPDGGVPPAAPAFADVNDLFSPSTTVSSVAFGSVDAGVMVANGNLYATQDRGLHIAQVGPPADGGLALGWNGVSMPSATDAYAVGIRGLAAISHDQGQTWRVVETGVPDDLEAVQFLPDSGTGFAVGESGAVVTTRNGGSSWTAVVPITSSVLTELAFADAQHGVVGGEDGAVLWTLDGQSYQVASDDFFGNLSGVAYPAPGVVVACASGGTLAHSTSQGQTFYGLATPAVTMGFGALAFVSRQNGWLAGNSPSGDIWVTSDGAQSFGLQFSGAQSLDAFSFVDAQNGYAVGGGGTVLATNTAGGPSCEVDADCADAGFAGINCLSGSCVPCTTDDRCGASCSACPQATPYCYGGYCGACESDTQCLPGFCAFGACQMTSPTSGGSMGTSGSTAATGGNGSSTGGSASGTAGATTSGGTGGCPPNSPYCSTSGCGCGTSRGGALWAVVFLALLARRRARAKH